MIFRKKAIIAHQTIETFHVFQQQQNKTKCPTTSEYSLAKAFVLKAQK